VSSRQAQEPFRFRNISPELLALLFRLDSELRCRQCGSISGVTCVIPIRRFVVTACAVLALGVAACSDTPTGPSSGAPYSQVDLRLGTGADAVTGKSVVVNYTCWLYDPAKADGKGLQFDTSVGTTPLTFTIGSGQVIQGFDRGVTGMKAGGARRMVIPPSLGYGAARNNSIPPYATLVFDVELVEVVQPQ